MICVPISEETAAKIDEEVKRIIDEAYNKAKTSYHPDTYRPFLKFYREQGYAITSKHLGYNLGLFTASSGVVNRTVQWFAYDSHDHRDACRKGYLTSGTKIDFTNDADKMIRQQESRVLIPTEFSPLRTIDPNHPLLTDPACERRMFEFNTYECRPGPT